MRIFFWGEGFGVSFQVFKDFFLVNGRGFGHRPASSEWLVLFVPNFVCRTVQLGPSVLPSLPPWGDGRDFKISEETLSLSLPLPRRQGSRERRNATKTSGGQRCGVGRRENWFLFLRRPHVMRYNDKERRAFEFWWRLETWYKFET